MENWQKMKKRQSILPTDNYKKLVSYFRVITLVMHFLIIGNSIAIYNNSSTDIETENNSSTYCYVIAKKIR